MDPLHDIHVVELQDRLCDSDMVTILSAIDAAWQAGHDAGVSEPKTTIHSVEALDALPMSAKLYSPETGNVWWIRSVRDKPRWQGSGGMWGSTYEFLFREGPFIRVDT